MTVSSSLVEDLEPKELIRQWFLAESFEPSKYRGSGLNENPLPSLLDFSWLRAWQHWNPGCSESIPAFCLRYCVFKDKKNGNLTLGVILNGHVKLSSLKKIVWVWKEVTFILKNVPTHTKMNLMRMDTIIRWPSSLLRPQEWILKVPSQWPKPQSYFYCPHNTWGPWETKLPPTNKHDLILQPFLNSKNTFHKELPPKPGLYIIFIIYHILYIMYIYIYIHYGSLSSTCFFLVGFRKIKMKIHQIHLGSQQLITIQ